jgi:hypothetical protein
MGARATLHYDEDSGQLAIPWGWRWPELYERLLVLASGRLPRLRGPWLVYDAITPQVLDVLTTKLDLDIGEGTNDA